VADIDTHGLRRTAGALWLYAGVDIYTVAKWLGHASVQTTEKAYAGVVDARHAAQIALVNAAAEVPKVASGRPKAASPTASPKAPRKGGRDA
jgi:integrase